MYLIYARNVNDAYRQGMRLLDRSGERMDSRAGQVLVTPCPVMTSYTNPNERVLFDDKRDANPFFHLAESLWMLAGKNDARWLDLFVSDFSSRFAESDGHQHGAYGFRWRQHFDVEGGGWHADQLNSIVTILRNNWQDRRVVLQMWDPVADLGRDFKDVPCNTQCYVRIREFGGNKYLDLTVMCRSNDIIWGAYGANAVHFSVLMEYLAARIGVNMGKLYQLSNNFHAYQDVFSEKIKMPLFMDDPYTTGVKPTQIVTNPNTFDLELEEAFAHEWNSPHDYDNHFLYTAETLFNAYRMWRNGDRHGAIDKLGGLPPTSDWYIAAHHWFQRRIKKAKEKARVS